MLWSVALPFAAVPGYHLGLPVGADSFTRLVRIEQRRESGDFRSTRLERAAWPEGADLHWTLPVDLFVYVPAEALRRTVGRFVGVDGRTADLLAGHLLQPLFLCLALERLLRACRRAGLGAAAGWSAGLLFLVQPPVMAYGMAPRIDHHVPFLWTCAGALAELARRRVRPGRLALWLAFALWLTFEALLLAVAVAAALALRAVLGERNAARDLVACFLLAALGAAAAAWVERGPAGLFSVEADRISGLTVFYLLLAAAAAAPPALVRPKSVLGRTLVTVASAFAVGLAALLARPDWMLAPFRLVDARLLEVWYGDVSELLPLVSEGRLQLEVAGALLGLPFGIAGAIHWLRGSDPDRRRLGAAALAGSTVFGAVACWQQRTALPAAVFWVPPAAAVLAFVAGRTARRFGPVPAAALVGVLLAAPCAVSALGAQGRTAPRQAGVGVAAPLDRRVALARWLDRTFADRPRVVFAPIDLSPVVLWASRHRVVAVPYHRNTQAVLDGAVVFGGTDPAGAFQALARRGADFVVFEGAYPPYFTDGPPPFLAPEPLPSDLRPWFRLYRFERGSPRGPRRDG